MINLENCHIYKIVIQFHYQMLKLFIHTLQSLCLISWCQSNSCSYFPQYISMFQMYQQITIRVWLHVSDVSTISHKRMTNMMPKRISSGPTSVPDVSETIPLACPSPPFARLIVGRRPSSLRPEEAAEHRLDPSVQHWALSYAPSFSTAVPWISCIF